MNITQILLGATAAMLLAALGLSYMSMRDGEAGDSRKQKAVELLQENASYEAELKRLREENRQLKMEREILKKVASGSSGEGDVS